MALLQHLEMFGTQSYSIFVNWLGLRIAILHILLLFVSLSNAQVDTFRLDNISTKKCRVDKFPVSWEAIDFTPPQKLKSTLTDIRPQACPGFKTKYLGKPTFEEIHPEDVLNKNLSRSDVKDVAKLDIQYLDRKHGLPGSSIYVMERDINGNILFSTDDGTLNSYDGTELTSYFFNDTIGDIRHISARDYSKKWISTANGIYYQEGESFYRLKNNWGNHFWKTSMDQEGVLWMTSYGDGIYFIENDSLFHLTNDEINIESKEIIRDQKGQVWVTCEDGVIRMSKRDTVIFKFEPKIGQASSIIEFEGDIYVGRFRKGMRLIKHDEVWDLDLGIDKFSVYDFEITKSGLWFSVYGLGLLLLEKDGDYHVFEEKDGLAQRSSHTLVSDDFGNIWVGDLFDGISVFSEAHFIANYSMPRLKAITDIDTLQDTTWFFYAWGAPIRKIGDTFFQMKVPSYFSQKTFIQNGAFEHGDKGWLQCYDYSFIKYEDDAFFNYEYSKDPQETLNHQVSLDKFGRVWAVNAKNELRFLKGDTIHLCHKGKSKTKNIFHKVKQLVIDTDQELYFNNQSEIFWTQEQEIYRHAFSEEKIKYIFKHNQIGVWVLTDKGFHHIAKEEKIDFYEFEFSDHCRFISAIDANNSICLATSEGFWELKIDGRDLVYEKAFGVNDFFRSNLFHYQDEIMISGAEFNNYYKPWWNLNKTYQPKLSISGITVAGVERNNFAETVLGPDEDLVVELNYQDWGKKGQLQYRLTRDENTQDWSSLIGKEITFDNLSSGDYDLEFRANNQSDKWVGTSLLFSVAPFWYESKWFFFLLIGVMLLGFYFIYQYREYRARKRELQLNKAVDSKTKELAAEKKQVEIQLQQKELLLKEVNHRVMNNMQMVSSILELQNSKTQDSASRKNLITARDRIKALALAHQHLYKNEQYETIKVKEYLSVVEKSLILDKDIRINLAIHPDLILPIERAQSLGLVLNELISNSLKHAWNPEMTNKQIEVELTECDHDYHWEYADNGQGLKSKDENENGLGTKLIRAIAKRQLSGDFEYVVDDGFRIKIKFPKL